LLLMIVAGWWRPRSVRLQPSPQLVFECFLRGLRELRGLRDRPKASRLDGPFVSFIDFVPSFLQSGISVRLRCLERRKPLSSFFSRCDAQVTRSLRNW